MLLFERDQLYLCVILSDFVVSKKVHQVKTHDCVHFLRVGNKLTELFIIVSLENAHVLLILIDVLLLNTEECGVLVDFPSEDALLCFRVKAGRDILEESKLTLQLLDDLVSLTQGRWRLSNHL